MAVIRGQRNLKNVTQDTLARDLQRAIVSIQSNRAPFISFLMALPSRPTKNPKFEHFEHDVLQGTVTVSGAHDNSVTTIQLASGHAAYVKVNAQLMNFTTDEIMVVTEVDVANDTVKVEGRGHGSTNASAIADTEVLGIISEAHEEGVAFSEAISNESTGDYNYVEEFETAVDMSWLKQATEELTEADWPFQVKQKVGEHKEKMERAFIFGLRDLRTGPNKKRVYYTGGIYWKVKDSASENFKDLNGGILTKPVVDAWLARIYSYGNANRKVIITSPLGWLTLSGLAEGFQTIQRSEKTLGMTIQKVEVNGHLYTIVEDQTLVKMGQEDFMLCVDMDHVMKRHLAANGKSFQPKWFQNVQASDMKGKKDVMYCVEGIQVSNPDAHGVMKNYVLAGS